MREALPWIILILEVAGIILLANEVYKGQKVEKVTVDFAFARRLLYLYAKEDFDGFMIEARLDQGDTPEQAKACVEMSGTAAIKTAAQGQWKVLAPGLSATISNWESIAAPAIRQARRRYLFTGAMFLMVAAFLKFLE